MKKIDPSFYRFLIVGLINTIIGTSTMFIAYNIFSISYWGSTFLNYFIGSIVSYFLNKYYTFRKTEKSIKEVFIFILNIAVCYFISYFLAIHLIQYLFNNQSTAFVTNISMFVGMILFVILNYLGQRIFVFKKSN